jgi:RNA polymerase primary sigma factor
MALLRAIDKFDYDRGFRFSTYATQVVRRNSYRMVMTKQKERQKQAASLEETGLDVESPDRSSSIDDVRWEQLRSRLSNLLSLLDRREQLIIRARFSLGGHRKVQTLQRLADILGVSKERVRQLEKRALDKLRDLAGSSDDLPLPADDFALAEAS